MAERIILVYMFVSFSIGLACLSVALLLARRKGDSLTRAYLASYASLSVLVASGLMLAFVDATSDVDPPFALTYLESIVGTYSVMFTLPFFAHRVFRVSDRRADVGLLAVISVALLGQHLTEFVLGGVWDDRGDVAEDVLFAAIVAYVLWVGVSRYRTPGVERPVAFRFLAILALGLPGTLYDLFLSDDGTLRLYPLIYSVSSVVMTWTFVQRRARQTQSRVHPGWGLSAREVEVLRLVQLGRSNKEIADQLHISTNTVKTHMKSLFQKTDSHSRFELIALASPETGALDGSEDSLPA